MICLWKGRLGFDPTEWNSQLLKQIIREKLFCCCSKYPHDSISFINPAFTNWVAQVAEIKWCSHDEQVSDMEFISSLTHSKGCMYFFHYTELPGCLPETRRTVKYRFLGFKPELLNQNLFWSKWVCLGIHDFKSSQDQSYDSQEQESCKM